MAKKEEIQEWESRTALLLGDKALVRLRKAHVLVVGLGGVGAYAAELICRAGIGSMTIVDGDKIEASNRNRQLPALASTQGISKAETIGTRLLDINPDLNLTIIEEFLRDERMKEVLKVNFDYVVDAIDTLSPKVYLISICLERGLKIVSAMGAGAKLDPEKVKVADLDKSYNCKLAKAIRKRLHRKSIYEGVKVVFSPEEISGEVIVLEDGEAENKKSTVGTISYMPAVFGCHCASVVLRELTEK